MRYNPASIFSPCPPLIQKSHCKNTMTHPTHDLILLRDKLRAFAAERDWEQFHTPKNLSMALMVEAAELLEHFQWLTASESDNLSSASKSEVAEELADVLLYLVRLSDTLKIDLLDAALRKLDKNAQKYPAEKVRGSSKKYSDY